MALVGQKEPGACGALHVQQLGLGQQLSHCGWRAHRMGP